MKPPRPSSQETAVFAAGVVEVITEIGRQHAVVNTGTVQLAMLHQARPEMIATNTTEPAKRFKAGAARSSLEHPLPRGIAPGGEYIHP